MRLPNRAGMAIDPVPFVVVTATASLLLLSFGPLYGQALGLPLSTAIVVSVGLCGVSAAVAYYRQVWTAEASLDVPATIRAERLFYLMAILGVGGVGLGVPLLL
ncbi:hypothetical protein [Halohasta salina]|uniref:hypothetical protein n=1 Tax=Halohasta salina TaxID=2961621 RepID=UPI0020A5A382|nr:hypothetical protein [Halohasta salina]